MKKKINFKWLCIVIVIFIISQFFYFDYFKSNNFVSDESDNSYLLPKVFAKDESAFNSELLICSQNLANYGQYPDVKNRVKWMNYTRYKEKEEALVRRLSIAKCDVIAVQEILASSKNKAQEVLAGLAKLLGNVTKREYEAIVGESNDSFLRTGFLIAKDSAEILGTHSFYKVELPKLSVGQKQRYFSRGPFEVMLRAGGKNGDKKIIKIINFHFKSRSGKSGRDPSGYDFEIPRMEMAEALRIIGTKEAKGNDDIIVMLGDRNDHYDTASAYIANGELTLNNFKYGGECSISKRGVPYCKNEKRNSAEFESVLVNDPQLKDVGGTLKYKKTSYWLDEILIIKRSLKYALKNKNVLGDYDSGVVAIPQNASDHSLVWVKLNWKE